MVLEQYDKDPTVLEQALSQKEFKKQWFLSIITNFHENLNLSYPLIIDLLCTAAGRKLDILLPDKNDLQHFPFYFQINTNFHETVIIT